MNIHLLTLVLIALIGLSAFFSASETALMSVNRYRIRHLANSHHRGAKLVNRLIEKPDKLLSVILLGNTFSNITASAVATIIASTYFGEAGILICTIFLTMVMLIFGEVTPKTLSALQALRVSIWTAYPLFVLQKLLYPFAVVSHKISLLLLRLMRVNPQASPQEDLNVEELKTLLRESGKQIPKHYKDMLLGILDLSQGTVEDIMVPKNEIVGIDLNHDWDDILLQISASPYKKLAVFKGSLDQIEGILHLRDIAALTAQGQLTKDILIRVCREPYYVPEGTSLMVQLMNFQKYQRRSGFVVDEYGDVVGLITLQDILQEIVGEYSGKDYKVLTKKGIYPEPEGTYLVDGSVNLRELNREMGWEFPIEKAKTLSGAIIENLEMIPFPQTCLRLVGYPIEILQVKGNMIRTVRILPKLRSI